jgi:hypothetical protein
MNLQHTPGPWEVEYGKQGWPRGIKAPHDMDVPGGVGNVVRWNGIGFPSSPTAKANARLIAAAPKMIDVLLWLNHQSGLTMEMQRRIYDAIKSAGATE